jgi:hypothetical protein
MWHSSNPFLFVLLLHSLSLISLPPPCLPATFPSLMPRPTSGQRASFWSRFIFSQHYYMSSCLFFYSGFHNGPEGL